MAIIAILEKWWCLVQNSSSMMERKVRLNQGRSAALRNKNAKREVLEPYVIYIFINHGQKNAMISFDHCQQQ